MNFTLHQLVVFLKITQTKSITKAAEELHLTQPAVSIQLKNLQDQFDIPLTEVIGRQLYVTEFGREIAVAAQKIIDEVSTINYKTLAYKGILSGKLKISVVSTGKYVIPYFLSDFMKMNSGIELVMDVTNKTKVVKSLKNNEVDFALVSIPPDDLALESEVLMANKLFLVGNKETLPIDTKPVQSDFFAKVPLIFREDGSATKTSMEKYLQQNGIVSNMRLQLTSNEAVKQAVVAGLGYSIMPLIGLKNELEKNDIVIIPAEGLPMITNWRLIWLKGKAMSPVAAAYLEFIRATKESIRLNSFSWIDAY
ncbi:LysR family transcriptional regulator [Flavobacterium sedimenticola]|uniref:LysR family transcriptional regulator n=1 Tax=Flavobacterium sedimenticola TaxID=3043286 RepID=A0ABT6XSS4_9FLAO|nr:LysR family transcriptional regulator [Flavobacterium sedimenticola]MDI9258143.1 LysR family transcriptional regulator [Flavobacterium sedimenticola]